MKLYLLEYCGCIFESSFCTLDVYKDLNKVQRDLLFDQQAKYENYKKSCEYHNEKVLNFKEYLSTATEAWRIRETKLK